MCVAVSLKEASVYLLSSQLKGKESKLEKFVLQDISRRHVSMCLLSYVLSIGLRVRSPQQESLDEGEFPLILYVRIAEFNRLQDFDAMNLWMKRHLVADKSKDNEWFHLIDYFNAPANHQSKYSATKFV
jgi:hypothetical protein